MKEVNKQEASQSQQFVKVKASVVTDLVDVPSELDEINLDSAEEQTGNFMTIDESL